MFSHMLVPLDGTPLAESALPTALALARRFDSRITLLHVLEARPPAQVHGTSHLGDPSRASAYLDEVAAWLTARGGVVEQHVHAPAMETVEGISDHVVEFGADVIVLCTHGARGLRGLVLGRVAQRVLAATVVPVLAVPAVDQPRSRDVELEPVVVPLDGSHDAETAIRFATALARPAGRVYLVRIVPTAGSLTGTEGALTRLLPHATEALLDAEVRAAGEYLVHQCERVVESGLPAEAVLGRGDALQGVLTAASSVEGKLVVLATHGTTGMTAVWAGRFGARLIEATRLPVLLVRTTHTPTR